MVAPEYVEPNRTALRTASRLSEPPEFWEVNEQLLLGSLREHALADRLQRQLAFSRTIAGSLAEGVYAIDDSARITFVNAAAEALLRSQEAALLGQAAPAILPLAISPDTKLPSAFTLMDVLQSSVTYLSEHALFTRQDHSVFPVSYSAAPIIVDNQVVGAVVAFHDLTEVQRLQRSQEEFLALLAHDLRTPLAAILGYAQHMERLVVQQPGLERVAADAAAVLQSGRRMNRLIQNVLDRTRLEEGQVLLNLEAIDLVAVLTLSIAENVSPQEQSRLAVDAVGELPLNADPIHLERLIVNLLTNAFKYSPPDSPVLIRAFSAGQHVMVSVADQGIGIHPDALPHLFEKQYHARPLGAPQGMTFGLYSSRLIAEAHGGRIWVQSEGGVGSTFWFSLPVSGP